VDGVPVANENQYKQQKSDKQQPRSFRGINRVPAFVRSLAGRVVLAMKTHDNLIVRRVA
jgi:hypothetical protein